MKYRNLNLNYEKHEEKGVSGIIAKVSKWLWTTFTSVKLAVLLLLLIAAASVGGIFFGEEDFFSSWWYLAPGSLLIINILACSLRRMKNIRADISGKQVRKPESFFNIPGEDPLRYHLPENSEVIENMLACELRGQGYRVRREENGGERCLAADRFRFSRLGTYISHLSLMLFVLAFLVGNAFGFRDANFHVIVGEIRTIGHDTGLSLGLESFEDEYYPDNTPKDYRSLVTLYEHGMPVRQETIRVNRPLVYRQVRVYQSGFGPAVRIRLSRQDFPDIVLGVAMAERSEELPYTRMSGAMESRSEALTLRFTSSAFNMADPVIPPGQLAVEVFRNGTRAGMDLLAKGQAVRVADMEMTYLEDLRYSGFQVGSNPGNALFLAASILFVLGISAVFFFVHRQVWIRISPHDSGSSQVLLRIISPRGYGRPAGMAAILEKLDDCQKDGQRDSPRGDI